MKKFLVAFALMVTVAFSASAQWWISSSTDRSTYAGDKAIEQIFKNIPIPNVTNAVERKMVVWRATIFNVENKLGYVYVICAGVGPIGYYTISGKVASLQSYLTPEFDYGGNAYDKPRPDLDGTYGSNVDGVFFRTTDGTYVELPTNGALSYLYADKPLPIKVPALNGSTATK